MASPNECLDALDAANQGRLSDEEIEVIADEINRARGAREKLDGLDRDLFDAAEQLAADANLAARLEKRNRIINVLKDSELTRLSLEADRAVDDPSMGLEAAMVGVNAPFVGSRASVDAKTNGILRMHLGGMIADLRKEGLLPVFNSGQLSREVSREMWDLSLKRPTGNATTSKQAKAIAKIVDKYRKSLIERENRAGAFIRYRHGYVTRQLHDPAKMRRGGFDAWRGEVIGRLDWDAMDVRPNRRERFMRSAYDNLVTSARGEVDESEVNFAFKGPGNLAKKESSSRVLLFKSADDWFDYNERFGRASLNEGIMGDFRRSAQATALMDTFGTNPRAMFDRMRDKLKQEHKSDARKVDRLNRHPLDWQFAEIDGSVNHAQNHLGASIGRSLRAIQSMAKLGGAFLSALADVPAAAAERRFQGRSLGAAYGDAFRAPFDGLTNRGQQRELAETIGVGIDGMLGDFVSRFAAQDDAPGRVSKYMALYFKLNLLGPWTDSIKRGVGMMMSNDLARMADGDWASLNMRTRTILAEYGFDADAWELARKAIITDDEGRRYMVPDGLPEATDRAGRRQRDRVSQMLGAYFNDRVDAASPTPGARERAILRQGHPPGTPMGEGIRFLMQFKSFPITVMTKVLGRDIYGHGAKSLRAGLLRGEGDLLGLVGFIAGAWAFGTFAYQAKEIAKGREPRDWSDPDLWRAGFLQGGGLGIYGDFLLGESNRFFGSPLETAVGPVVGEASGAIELWQRATTDIFQGEKPDVAAESLNFVKGNMPFLNLFYTKAALDYLLIYRMQEAINPGYLRRMERRMKRENNQEFFLPPSQAVR